MENQHGTENDDVGSLSSRQTASRKHRRNTSISMAGELTQQSMDQESLPSVSTRKRMAKLLLRGEWVSSNDVPMEGVVEMDDDENLSIVPGAYHAVHLKESSESSSTDDASDLSNISNVARVERFEDERIFSRIRFYSFDSDEAVAEEATGGQSIGDVAIGDIESSTKRRVKIPRIKLDSSLGPNDKKGRSQKDKRNPWFCFGNCSKRRLKVIIIIEIAIFVLFVLVAGSFAVKSLKAKARVNTPVPTISIAPSNAPSISFSPTDLPSVSPSQNPTFTVKPSDLPSTIPTTSLAPSASPSMIPSSIPSNAPTDLPTTSPSWSPTLGPISRDRSFKLRLQWEEGYFWQEDTKETFWCVECTRCEERGREDGWMHGCRRYGSGHASNCREDDLLWIMDCRSRGARFNVLQNKDNDGRDIGYQLRLDGTNFCMKRIGMHVVVKKCDSGDVNQRFVGWSSNEMGKFPLRPYTMKDWSERDALCISNWHHPKPEEVIGMRNCREERRYNTVYWEEY